MILINIGFVFLFSYILTTADYSERKGYYIMDGLIFAFNLAIVLDYFL